MKNASMILPEAKHWCILIIVGKAIEGRFDTKSKLNLYLTDVDLKSMKCDTTLGKNKA